MLLILPWCKAKGTNQSSKTYIAYINSKFSRTLQSYRLFFYQRRHKFPTSLAICHQFKIQTRIPLQLYRHVSVHQVSWESNFHEEKKIIKSPKLPPAQGQGRPWMTRKIIQFNSKPLNEAQDHSIQFQTERHLVCKRDNCQDWRKLQL